MILENLKSENLKEKKHKNSKSKVIVLCGMAGILLCVMILYGVFIMDTGKKEKEGTTLTIAISSDTRISNLDTNYYKEWLEQQTGDTIQFEYIYRGFEKEYLNAMLTTEHNTIDAVFLPEEQKLLSKEEFEHFVSQGLIFDLSGCQTPESNLTHIVEEYGNKSEALYYFPGIDTSRKSQNLQVLWINVSWLKALGLQVPRTTEELALVLQAFKEGDPNGNGLQDELPLICCQAEETFCSYDYLLNAYTYYDPTSAGIYQDEQGNVVYAPITDQFREGLQYTASLHEEDSLSDTCFSYSTKQLMELVNTPENLVGAFTSQSISDVVYPNCSDILAKYIQVAPLLNEDGTGNAVKLSYEWEIGGYIPANSPHPEEAFALMDLMLSEEAALIATFGEEGVDWKYSDKGDISTYGVSARITTLNYLEDSVQNKNFAGAGPCVLKPEYANGVTWNGNNSLVEYIDARAVKSYEPYYKDVAAPQSEDNIIVAADEMKELKAYTDEMIWLFLTRQLPVEEDEAWNIFCSEYMELAKRAVKIQ